MQIAVKTDPSQVDGRKFVIPSVQNNKIKRQQKLLEILEGRELFNFGDVDEFMRAGNSEVHA
jgi:hypothetical protein